MPLFQWFYDARQAGVLELAGSIPSTGDHPITSGSALVLLHDQDSVGKLYIYGYFTTTVL